MTITDGHRLSGVPFDEIASPGKMPVRRCLVIHFTAGATGRSSITAMRERGVSAHLVIERDGAITQCVPFDRRAAHAGVSRWRDPRNGNLHIGANTFSIGIELANAGNDDGALSWARKQPHFTSIKARHRNGGPLVEWEAFPFDQVKACTEVANLLVARYQLDDITGHDCIAPERKDDPGPAFPMQALREACGFPGLPAVHKV